MGAPNNVIGPGLVAFTGGEPLHNTENRFKPTKVARKSCAIGLIIPKV